MVILFCFVEVMAVCANYACGCNCGWLVEVNHVTIVEWLSGAALGFGVVSVHYLSTITSTSLCGPCAQCTVLIRELLQPCSHVHAVN